MTSVWRAASAAMATALLVGCDQLMQPPAENPFALSEQEIEDSTPGCPIIDSRDWAASIETAPDATRTLRVRGVVDFPAAGYTWSITRFPGDDPHSPTLDLNLVVSEPAALGAEAITPTNVSFAGPAEATHYTEVSVICDGDQLAIISNMSQ